MRRTAQIRVECFAEVLCPHLSRVFGLGFESADSPRKPEDVLSQGLKSASRFRAVSALLFVFFFLAACMPLAFAQEPTPADATTNAETTSKEPAPTSAPSSGTADELQVAQQQGKADTAILERVLATSGPAKGDTRAGDVRVAFTITPAEGWWDKASGNKLTWHEAPANNVHLRIFVLSLSDGRLLPGLSLCATLTDANGNEQSVPTDLGWYPLMNAYGGNVPLAADSSYILRVTLEGSPPHPGSPSAEHIQHVIAEFPPVDIAQDAISQLPLATATAWANEAELLKPSNAALKTAITALWQRTAAGIEKASDDYFVGYALDDSESALQVGGKLHLKNPFDFSGKDNVLIDVLARDSRTGRFIPGLKPHVDLVAPDGKTLGPGETFLIWHPWLPHYTRSTRIPRKGVYQLRVHFDAPGFRRWGRQSERFAAPADVEFENISLNPEKKN